jgi:hypothetical protein
VFFKPLNIRKLLRFYSSVRVKMMSISILEDRMPGHSLELASIEYVFVSAIHLLPHGTRVEP